MLFLVHLLYLGRLPNPRPSENTITTLLWQELRQLGVPCQTFAEMSTPAGRREPDIYLQEAGNYVVEAKFHKTELPQAIAKIYDDYLKHAGLLMLQGGVAVLYPDELDRQMSPTELEQAAASAKYRALAMFAPADPRPLTDAEGTLTEIASWIQKLTQAAPIAAPSVQTIIDVLQSAVNTLKASLSTIQGVQLEDIFGGRGVFENILQYRPKEYPMAAMQEGAAYILVNQLLFYHSLAEHDPQRFPAVEEDLLSEPKELQAVFKHALDVDYTAVFSYDVASRLDKKYLPLVREVIKTIKGLTPQKIRLDILGTVFHDLIPREVRERVAAYYTNVLAAELLARLSIQSPEAKVADFAVGSGGLLAASYRTKRSLQEQNGKFTVAVHKRFTEKELLGVDVMPFAAHLAAINLALQAPDALTDKVAVAVWDSTALSPGTTIKPISSFDASTATHYLLEDFGRAGPISLQGDDERQLSLENMDIIMMNPPFTRQERLPETYKKTLAARFKGYDEFMSGTMGYYAYFILLADRFLHKGGKIAMVLPATILKVDATAGIRRFLIRNYSIDYIVTTWERAAFSEAAIFREILLVATKVNDVRERRPVDPSMPCVVANVQRLPETPDDADELANQIRSLSLPTAHHTIAQPNLSAIRISQKEVANSVENLYVLVAPHDASLARLFVDIMTTGEHSLQKLDDYLKSTKGRLVGGVGVSGTQPDEVNQTGQLQSLFVLADESSAKKKHDVWVLSKSSSRSITARHRIVGKSFEIPLKAVRPSLRRLSGVGTLDVTKTQDYFIVGRFPEMSEFLKLSAGRVDMDFIKRRWQQGMDRMGNVALARRFDATATGTTHLAFYSHRDMVPGGVMWSLKVSNEDAKILCIWLNSTLNILQSLLQRKETRGGYMQLDKYTLGEMRVISPKLLTSKQKDTLIEVFGKIRNTNFPSLLEQLEQHNPARVVMDKAVLKVLGFKGDLDRSAIELETRVAGELRALKTLMDGAG